MKLEFAVEEKVCMDAITIINPNSSRKTTDMMVDIACRYGDGKYRLEGRTATRSPGMIVDEPALIAAAAEVVEMGREEAGREDVAGLMVAAFGDPGLEELRRETSKPVVGLCEAGMLAAAAGGRRFAVAATTPDLVAAIATKAHRLGLGGQFAGVRLAGGDPLQLAADPALTLERLAEVTRACVRRDGAEVVIIGGGPLGQAAVALSEKLGLPVIAPIMEAMLMLRKMMEG